MPRRSKSDEGFSLLEVMFASFIAFFILTALFGLVTGSLQESKSAGRQSVATNFGNLVLEQARTIPYTQVGTVGAAYPDVPGVLASSETTTYEGLTFKVDRKVTWVNDTADNVPRGDPSGADSDPYDYKRVDIRISWTTARGTTPTLRFQTFVRDKGEEETHPPTVEFTSVVPADWSVLYGSYKWNGVVNDTGGGHVGTVVAEATCFDDPLDAPNGYVARLEYWVDGLALYDGATYASWSIEAADNPFTNPAYTLNTLAQDASGTPIWPDGLRALKVQAWDNTGARDFRIRQFVVDNYAPTWISSSIQVKRPSDDVALDSNQSRYNSRLVLLFTPATDGSDTVSRYDLSTRRNGAAAVTTLYANLGTSGKYEIGGLDPFTAYTAQIRPRSVRGLPASNSPVSNNRITNPKLTGRTTKSGSKANVFVTVSPATSLLATYGGTMTYELYKAASYSGKGDLVAPTKIGASTTTPFTDVNYEGAAVNAGYYYQVKTIWSSDGVARWSNVIGPTAAAAAVVPVP